jgi:hypothetical protein
MKLKIKGGNMKIFIINIIILLLITTCSYSTILDKTSHIPGYPLIVHDYGDHVVHECGPDEENDCYVVELWWDSYSVGSGPVLPPNDEFHLFIRENTSTEEGYGYINSEIQENYDTENNTPVPTIYINQETQTFDDYSEWKDALENLFGIGI